MAIEMRTSRLKILEAGIPKRLSPYFCSSIMATAVSEKVKKGIRIPVAMTSFL
jgi:hypothetical protein